MAVADIKRVSTALGGCGNHLSPTGYSLIEYNHKTIYTLCGELLKTKVNSGYLEDWRNLVFLFPQSREKLSKRQGRILRKYVDYIRLETLHSLNSNNIDKLIVKLEV